MKDPPVKKDVGGQLPQKILLPNQDGNECKVVNEIIDVDFELADFNYFLEEKESNHDNDQIFDDGGQPLSKRETVMVVSHFNLLSLNPPNPPLVKGGRGGIF
jgi:hypothetical protein